MSMSINTSFRSEEEKAKDILIYEKKAKAGDIAKKYEKTKKRADLATVIAAAVLLAAASPVFYNAYDTENLSGMALIALTVILLTAAVRLTVGAILSRSLHTFIKWGSLCAKWTYARKDMHDCEEKFADQKLFEDDMKKVEGRLMDICEALISFAEEKGINTDN